MEIETGEGQLQIHLVTKQSQFAVPDIPYSIGASVTTAELNTFVNALLQETGDAKSSKSIDFEFIILNEFLRTRLSDHLKERSISFEDTIEIEYVERYPVPEPQECLLHDDWVSAVETRGKWILTGCYDNTVNMWLVNGKHLLTIPGHTAPIKAVSWISMNDGVGTFASASQDQTVMLWEWNVESNAVDCIYVCKGHERGVDSLATSPSTKLLASGSWDTMLKIWSCEMHGDDDNGEVSSKRLKGAQTRTPISTLAGHREAISGIQWLNEESILTGSWDHTLRVWDLSNGGIKTEINGNKPIFSVSHSKLNGLVVTGSADKNIRLYDLRSNSGTIVKNTYVGHTQWIQSVCWSTTEEHLFISGSYDNQVKLWDMRSPKAPLFDLLGHTDKVHDCDWSNPKYMVSGGADNSVRIFKSKKAPPS